MARAVAGSERILLKLNKLLQDNELYEAHQLYRTLHFRMSNSNRHAEAAKLLLEGANLFLDKQQSNSGADLAQLYVDVIKNDPEMVQSTLFSNARIRFDLIIMKILRFFQNFKTLTFKMSLLKMLPIFTLESHQNHRNDWLW
jgi:hypothetical protein